MVWWLRCHASSASTAEGMGLIPGWGTKVPRAAHGTAGKKKKSKNTKKQPMRLRSNLSQVKWAGSGFNRDERGEVQIMMFPVTHKCLWHF